MRIEPISLSKLIPSADNVRKTGKLTGIAELAASIAAHGLLHNLHVRDNGNGKFEVVAGGRRLAALKKLATDKAIKKTEPIPCTVLDAQDSAEISLAENVMRESMHPADQFEAFKKLADEGKGPEEIAARFGTTPDTVRRRMKLAAVSPHLIEIYRKDEMTLDQLIAFAVSDDHAAQEAAWFEMPRHDRSASSIRRALTNAYASASDKRALLVGLDAYTASGGAVIRDLFQPESEGYLTDTALLDRLVAERLEQFATQARAEGWKRVEIQPTAQTWSYGRIAGEPVMTAKQRTKFEKLCADKDALTESYSEEVDDDTAQKLCAKIDALEEKIEAITGKLALAWSDEDRARCTAVVSIGIDGSARTERGLIHPDDKKVETENGKAEEAGNAAPEKEDKPAFSATLIQSLTAQRTAALQAEFAANPHVALVAVVHSLALPIFDGGASCLIFHAPKARLRDGDPAISNCAAITGLAERHRFWTAQIGDPESLWDWLLTQTPDTLLELLAYCAARSIDAIRTAHGTQADRLAHADMLADALQLDMRRWWQVSGPGYLAKLSKVQIIEALKEANAMPAQERIVMGWKKDALVKTAEARLAAKNWLPVLLRPSGNPQPEGLSEAA